MDANLDLMDIGRVEISLQTLIGANHINYDVQEWLFEEVTNMPNMGFKEKKRKKIIIYKYTWFKGMHHNGCGELRFVTSIFPFIEGIWAC